MNNTLCLVIVCFIFLLYDYFKTKKVYSPMVIFNLIWIITISLYELKISYIQQDLLPRTIYLFWLNVLGFNITYFIISIFKLNFFKIRMPKSLKYTTNDRVKFARNIILLILVIEFIYSRGFPIMWKILNINKTYFDYGIPSIHGAFNGLVICLGAYSFFKKSNDKFLYLFIGIITLSRQVMISMVIEAIIYNLFITKKIAWKKYVGIIIIGLIFFSILGNFRSGSNTMDNAFQPKPEYKNIPNSIKWVYSYMTFSISNFNNLVTKTNGAVNKGASMFNSIVPTVLSEKINFQEKYKPFYLISLNYNVSTSFPEIYLDFGTKGILIFGIFLAIIGNVFYQKMVLFPTDAHILSFSVYIHNIIFLFFINMFLYLPLIVQFIYIPLIFVNKKSDDKSN